MDRAEITPTLVSCLVASQFPQWADLPVRPVDLDGWDNTTFRLGEGLSVRLPSRESCVLQVRKEHRFLPRLAPFLPLPIPTPVRRGVPACGFPRPWSIYGWIDGTPVSVRPPEDLVSLAADLSDFLAALYRIDAVDGPRPGAHNFFRGGDLAVYDAEARAAITVLRDEIDHEAATAIWEAALAASWDGRRVFVHGDVAAGNLVSKEGRLCAVIDFGGLAMGDPACDTVVAWTLFSGESRERFQRSLPVDDETWVRGRGWALWKAAIILAESREADPDGAAETRRVLGEILGRDALPRRSVHERR